MINIYTHTQNPIRKEWWKAVAKKLLGKYSGPNAVRDSLLRGLQEHQVAYELNPIRRPAGPAIVLSGVAALQQAIKYKNSGHITTLMAGPNIVVSPHDANQILLNPAIDYILVPSRWVADYYQTIVPELAKKVVVWPAGTAEAQSSSRDGEVLVYCKTQDTAICQSTVTIAKQAGFPVRIFTYGTFKHQDYLESLSQARAVVYLSASESQGLALQEAWIRNVPTFVHFTGTTSTNVFTWQDDYINAPYLTDKFGDFYRSAEELTKLLTTVTEYNPRELCKMTLSDYASTKQLLELITDSYDYNQS